MRLSHLFGVHGFGNGTHGALRVAIHARLSSRSDTDLIENHEVVRITLDTFIGAQPQNEWCPGAESNHRHADFQSAALPTELPGHCLTEYC